jgi:hypothetical protein
VPESVPSALNDVVGNMAQMVDGLNVRSARGSQSRFNYAVTGYGGGSDHMMFIDRKIPGMMFGHSPDYTHHTSDDTPDKVDPVELERTEIIATATTLYLSDLSAEEAVDLVYLTGANAAARLGAAARRAHRLLAASDLEPATAWFEARNALQHAGGWEREAVASIATFHDGESVRRAIAGVQRQLQRQEDDLLVSLREAAGAAGTSLERPFPTDDRVPERLTRGPLDFGLPASRLPADAAAWYGSSDFTLDGSQRFELVNFIDGRRTVSEIRDALAAEYGPVPQEVVARYIEDLVRVEVVGWR